MSRFVLTFAVFKCFDAVLFCSLMNVTSKSKNVKLARFSFVFLSYSDQTNSETQRGKKSLFSQQLRFMFELLFLSKALSGEEFVPVDLEADSSDSNNNIFIFIIGIRATSRIKRCFVVVVF